MEIRNTARTMTTKTAVVKGNWTLSSRKMKRAAEDAALRACRETRDSVFGMTVEVDVTGDTVYTFHTD